MAEKYEMHVYTMGTRAYAEEVCAAIDPDGKFFGGRILSRDESGSALCATSVSSAYTDDISTLLRYDTEEPTEVVPCRYFYGGDHRRPGGRLGMESQPHQSHTL